MNTKIWRVVKKKKKSSSIFAFKTKKKKTVFFFFFCGKEGGGQGDLSYSSKCNDNVTVYQATGIRKYSPDKGYFYVTANVVLEDMGLLDSE